MAEMFGLRSPVPSPTNARPGQIAHDIGDRENVVACGDDERADEDGLSRTHNRSDSQPPGTANNQTIAE